MAAEASAGGSEKREFSPKSATQEGRRELSCSLAHTAYVFTAILKWPLFKHSRASKVSVCLATCQSVAEKRASKFYTGLRCEFTSVGKRSQESPPLCFPRAFVPPLSGPFRQPPSYTTSAKGLSLYSPRISDKNVRLTFTGKLSPGSSYTQT